MRSGDDELPGVYGLKGLHRPEDFARLASHATATSESIAHPLRTGTRNGICVINDLDSISDAVCKVVDVAELCRNTHSDPQWVVAAEKAYVQLQQYVHTLNADKGLYDALVRMHEAHLEEERRLRSQANGIDAVRSGEGDVVRQQANSQYDASTSQKNNLLPPEAARVALTLRRDFERGGIHLDSGNKANLERAASNVIQHGMTFQRNLVDLDQLGSIEISRDKLKSMPHSVMQRASTNIKNNSISLPLDNRTLGTCMRYISDRSTRETIYKAAHQTPHGNKRALEGLLTSRAEVADLLGYDSHASYMTENLLAGHPNAVREAIKELVESTADRAHLEQTHLRSFFGNKEGRAIQSWDKAFLAGRARDSSKSNTTQSTNDYFPLSRVVHGAGELVERVFGIKFELNEVPAHEKWCPDARKIVVTDANTNEYLGTIFLDLTPRPGKFPHAAHFVIRCSRDRTGDGQTRTGDGLPTTSRQHPSVALVCNFGHHGGSFSNTYLSHGELETFLHELGHSVHSVLSKTKYQHLSGTRCASDLVEVPSHVFEYFAWDADALRLLSSHRTSGEKIPKQLIQKLKKGKDLFAASDLRQQLLFASVDLETHDFGGGEGRGISSQSIRDIAGQISLKMMTGGNASHYSDESKCAWELRFGHVVGYASTYYSYVYAKLLAADVWGKFFHGASLEKNSGVRITTGLLQHGGAVAPDVLLRELLGKDALRDISSVGVISHGGISGPSVGAVPSQHALLKELQSWNPYE